MFDLKQIDPVADANAGAWLHLQDTRYRPPRPIHDADGNPCRLLIAGAHSDVARKETDRQAKRREQREEKRFADLVASGVKPEEAKRKARSTQAETREDNAEFYARLTLDWENIQYDGESKPKFETFKRMYLDNDWIAGQVLDILGKTEAFIRQPLTPSKPTSDKAPG